MAANPLRIAHQDALKRAKWLDWAFGSFFGSKQHPRGQVLSHYRKARREMGDVLKADRRTKRGEVIDVLNDLKREVRRTASDAMAAGAEQGAESAARQLAAYAQDGVSYNAAIGVARIDSPVATVMADYDKQASAVMSLVDGFTGNISSEIVGDDSRVGILQPAGLIATATRALGNAMGAGFTAYVGAQPAQDFGWGKQPIPAIDDRTTDTCLRVAGQKRALDEPFHLTGTPRFADDMQWTPFHWYCRTSVALYLQTYDDGLTQALREDVRAERQNRESQD